MMEVGWPVRHPLKTSKGARKRNEDRNLEGAGSLGRDKLISLIFETL